MRWLLIFLALHAYYSLFIDPLRITQVWKNNLFLYRFLFFTMYPHMCLCTLFIHEKGSHRVCNSTAQTLSMWRSVGRIQNFPVRLTGYQESTFSGITIPWLDSLIRFEKPPDWKEKAPWGNKSKIIMCFGNLLKMWSFKGKKCNWMSILQISHTRLSGDDRTGSCRLWWAKNNSHL